MLSSNPSWLSLLSKFSQQVSRSLDPQAILRCAEDYLVDMQRWSRVAVVPAGSAAPGSAADGSRLAVPIAFDGQALGQIELESPQPCTPDERAFLQTLAGILALALKNAQGAAALQAQAFDSQHTGTRLLEDEQVLARLAERLDLAVRSAGIGIWDWDIQRNEIIWDDQMYALYGLQPGGFGGAYEAWLQGVHPDDRAASDERSAQAVRGEGEFDTEFRVLWPDGAVHWLKAAGQVFRDPSGAPVRMVGVNYDITERKQAEAALQKLAYLLAEGQRIAHVGSFEYLAASQQTVWSDEEFRIYGYDPEQPSPDYATMLAKSIHPEDAALLDQTFRSAMQNRAVYELEHRIVRPDGSVRWVYDRAHPTYDSKGQLVRYAGVTLDITERKALEESLRESEQRYALLFEKSAVPTVLLKLPEVLIADANQAAVTLTGYTREEMLGKTSVELGLAPPPEREQVIARFQQPGALQSRELSLVTRSGEPRVVVVNTVPVQLGGQPYAISTMLDITQRKQAEDALFHSQQAFTHAFDANPAAMAITRRADGRFIRINAAYTAMIGYQPDELLGRSAREIDVYTDYAERQVLLDRLQQQGYVQDHEIQFRVKSGAVRTTVVNMVPIQFAGEDCLLSALLDITERRRMEDELRRSNADLEQFAYIASHDLQEPLRSVAGMVELLRQRYQGQLDERADNYIALAVEGAQRMQQLIIDLLQYSRLNRTGRSFEAAPLEAALQSALRNLRAAIQESQAQITWDPLPGVTGDLLQLSQVFQNLLGNAIKFRSPERPPQIHISARQVERAWQIAVADNGIGIKPEQFERIFLVFQRLHPRQAYPGTGIGLALCKKIVERHGGTIWVESTPGQGATLFFTLAASSAAPEAEYDTIPRTD